MNAYTKPAGFKHAQLLLFKVFSAVNDCKSIDLQSFVATYTIESWFQLCFDQDNTVNMNIGVIVNSTDISNF